jgi:hypothetical protein
VLARLQPPVGAITLADVVAAEAWARNEAAVLVARAEAAR